MNASEPVRFFADGRELSAPAGSNLLAALRAAGIEVPSLCWHARLSPTGACRLCVVKIEGVRGLPTSCSTLVEEGMRVTAFDDELEAARRYLLFCLAEEVALGSDGSHRDELEELLLRYGIRPPAKRRASRGRDRAIDVSSPVLTFDASRCIKCFRCVKACEEIQGKGVLSVDGRGLDSVILAGDGTWGASECDGCGECVQVCPTGALVEKPNRVSLAASAAFVTEGRETEQVRTTCPYCGVGCQLDLTVGDGRILRSDGAAGLPPNDGRLCVKGRFGYGFVDHPDRLKTPLLREGGSFREATWDEALDRAAEGFNAIRLKYGGDALAGYSSAKCTNEENYLFQKLVRVSFGTNNLDYCTRLCHASTVTAMLKAIGDGAGSASIEDFENADCTLVIGNNMAETHPVTATFLKRGLARGGSLLIIDPRWTPLVRHADVWIQARLGTDVALLNGMIRIVFERGWADGNFARSRVQGGQGALDALRMAVDAYTPEHVQKICGVPPEKLLAATRLYALADRALIATGMGMSQQTVGTDNVFALMNLMLVCGKIGRDGSGLAPPRGQNNVQGATDVGCSPLFYPGYVPASDEATRRRLAELWGVSFDSLPAEKGLTTVEIAKAAHDGRIRGLLIMGENPVMTDPNASHVEEALDCLDFLAVSDIFLTPTARRADVVFPAACWAEKDGTFVNSNRRVLRVRKAVPPPGQAREDSWILLELARRMGRPIGAYATASEIWDETARAAPGIFGGVSWARIEERGIQWPCPTPDHPGTRTLFLERFNTPDGLARIFPVDWKPQAELPDDEYPLVVNTGRILYQYHSSTMSRRAAPLDAFAPEGYILLHPSDAARFKLAEGDRAGIVSRRGRVEANVRVTGRVREGEPFMPFHYEASRVNLLTRDELDPSSKIAPFKNTPVRIERS